MLQIALTLALFVILVIPVGIYVYHVAEQKKTFADPVFNKVGNFLLKVMHVNTSSMNWKKYALTFLMVNAVMILIGYLVLRLQAWLFLNPNDIAGMESTLSFNTIISFMTNTNLQHYAGESGLSHLSQMVVIMMQMFTSAASGYCVCMAMIRGLCGKEMGNFYVDMTRCITRIMLPLSFVISLILVSQGVMQNLSATVTLQTIEGRLQDMAQGPIAALESIKHLGTNGGGFTGANSANPLENPNIITNIVEMISMMLMPGACIITFGHMVHDKWSKENKNLKKILFGTQGRCIFMASSIIFLLGLSICYAAELSGNPVFEKLGLVMSGNMEGKELRFGIAQSSLFTTVTTAFTTGTVNNMHDTLTPLGGLVPLLNMMLNVVFGGDGVGLMNILVYALLAVFICGLMIGRTPEFLGKKIEGREMKLVALSIIIHPLLILGFSALAVTMSGGLAGISNPGYHGLSQILYEFSSSAANNGSGFEGLADNTAFWNITTGLAMFFGRYLIIVPQLAIAGSLLKKKEVGVSVGTLRTDTSTFSMVLVMVILIIAALTFLPALALGPIAEQLTLWY